MRDLNATVIVKLNRSEKEIFENLQKDARWGIKKAEKDGLIVEESNEWGEFYKIYLETMKHAKVKPETLSHIKEHADVLFICKKEEIIIGGATLHVIDNVPVLTRNASLADYQKYQPNNLLYWKCICWSKQKNYSYLDLGGWQINPRDNAIGVNKFKERWGEIVYYHKNYPFYKALGRKLIRKYDMFYYLNRKLRSRS